MNKTLTTLFIISVFTTVTACKPITLGKLKASEQKVEENEEIIDKMIYKDKIEKLRTQNANTILELQTIKSCLRMKGLQQEMKGKIKSSKHEDLEKGVKGYQNGLKSVNKFITRYKCDTVLKAIITRPTQ